MKLQNRQATLTLVLCPLFAALIAAGAFFKFNISLIPITFQGFFVLLAGMLLGSKKGALSVALYVCIGLVGFPIFAYGGGPMYIFNPTFGFLLGFIGSAFVTGKLTEKLKQPTYIQLLIASLVGRIPMYLIGLPYLYLIKNFYMHTDFKLSTLLIYGFLIFIPSDTLSWIVSVFIAKRVLPLIKKTI